MKPTVEAMLCESAEKDLDSPNTVEGRSRSLE